MLLDLLKNHPEYLLAGLVAWIIVIAWVMSLIHRMIMNEVDFLSGVIGIGVAMGLGVMSISPTVPILQPISIGALYLSGIFVPLAQIAYNRHEIKDIDIDGVQKAYEGFVLRPNNPASKIRLARHLYTLGVRGHAYVLAESALDDLPRRYFPDEHRMMAQWRQRPPPESEFAPIRCVECGFDNPAGNVHCARCGSRFLLDRVKGRFVSGDFGKKLVAIWILMMLALVGLPVAASLGGLGGLCAIVVIAAMAVGAAIKAFSSEKGTGP